MEYEFSGNKIISQIKRFKNTGEGLVIPQWVSLNFSGGSDSYCLGNCYVPSVKLFLQMRRYFELFIEN